MTTNPFYARPAPPPAWAVTDTGAWPTSGGHPSAEADRRAMPPPRPGVFRGAAPVPTPPADALRRAPATWRPPAVLSPLRVRADALTPDEPSDDDAEARLAACGNQLDPRTLREIVARPAVVRALREDLGHALTRAADDGSRARLLSLRAVASRLLGDLAEALRDGRWALEHARAVGELRQLAVVRARLAHIHQWRGEFDTADRLLALAASPELPHALRAGVHEQAGRSCYEQGRLVEALTHFDAAVSLCGDARTALMARIDLALQAVAERAGRDGFGPRPRDRAALLGVPPAPVPTRDDRTGAWGYTDARGRPVVPAAYRQAQPFGEGMAWVQREEAGPWQLIDATGAARTPAIYDDVRAFRHGVAAVRRDRWGAIDAAGRVVVPLRYRGFSTALADGRYVDGFSEEGLAVVDTGDHRGVLDRTGRQLVEPRYRTVVIHPLAFLIVDRAGRWGALDRRGRPLISPAHCDRRAVHAALTRRLRVTAPVL
ncbi:MAG TPA: WG repeat-containing protein [Pilimelia sp.]|nr:WG repeat-containing protein [Pilimelia sp.]